MAHRSSFDKPAGFHHKGLMTLVMFDIDGTLTETFELDGVTYLDALRDVCGFDDVSDDWASYRHVTDSGIFAEVFQARAGRLPSTDEVARVQTHFVTLFRERVTAAGGLKAVPGAGGLLARLIASPDYAVSYASGGWSGSALFKLRSAGLPAGEVPAAFSDTESTREGICLLSSERAQAHYGRAFSSVVYVGDGVWDVRTAGNLGYHFIGVGRGARAGALRAAGATEVLPDFEDAGRFFALLEACRRQEAAAGG
jgi:phosphoglycolate phosphatase-like HAD superfamily hydrolase